MTEIIQRDQDVGATLERVAYGLAEAAQAIGLGDTKLAEIVHSGQIRSFRIGRRVLIRKSDLLAFADRLFDEQNGGLS